MSIVIEKTLDFDYNSIEKSFFDNFDTNLKKVEEGFGVRIFLRDHVVKIQGLTENVENAYAVMEAIIRHKDSTDELSAQTVNYFISLAKDGEMDKLSGFSNETIYVSARGKYVRPKTFGQSLYARAIKENDIVFGIGPAGTGKTFLAVANAVKALKNKDVERLVLTRPAVEAGEKLGFLPGDLQDKVDPYLRPLYDALHELLGPDTYLKYIEKGIIEIAPLAYMRGRTLENAFFILDEAQNTTQEQMKMFLTRMGYGSKTVVTGDITQIDLSYDKKSGLKEVIHVLNNVEGIKFIHLTEKDVVRHPLVQSIIKAYDSADKKGSL